MEVFHRQNCMSPTTKEKKKTLLKITLQTSETSHNSPHHWVYFIPCCFGGVQSRPLGQTTSPSSGLFHPITSPSALLAASSTINTEESKGSAPQMDPCSCSLGRKNILLLPPPTPHHHHSCIYVRDSFIKHSERSCSNRCHSKPHSFVQLAVVYMASVLTCGLFLRKCIAHFPEVTGHLCKEQKIQQSNTNRTKVDRFGCTERLIDVELAAIVFL